MFCSSRQKRIKQGTRSEKLKKKSKKEGNDEARLPAHGKRRALEPQLVRLERERVKEGRVGEKTQIGRWRNDIFKGIRELFYKAEDRSMLITSGGRD